MATETLTLCDCGHEPTPNAGCGTGYATNRETGATACYACADAATRQDIRDSVPGDRITLYLSSDGAWITTWPGGRVMGRVTFGKEHAASRRGWQETRWYLTATDELGRVWSGVGAEGMYCALRLTKRTDPRGGVAIA